MVVSKVWPENGKTKAFFESFGVRIYNMFGPHIIENELQT